MAPDPDEARRLAEEELSRLPYQEAQPTPLDRFARGVAEFLADLFSGRVPDGLGPWLAVAAVAVVAALIVAAVLIWGRPRRAARSRADTVLFGESETRTSGQLRAAAEAAAARGEWNEAVALRVRAIARRLVERTLIDPVPGATVHRFAADAAAVFPVAAADLAAAAAAFDDVRYFHRPGTPEAYRAVRELDDRLATLRPVIAA